MKIFTKNNRILIIPVLLFLILLNSCQSPMDIDTPRKKIPLTTNRVLPSLTQMSFEENGEMKYFTVNDAFALIDTLGEVPYVWMNMSFESNGVPDLEKNGICITKFTTYLDSLPINGMNSTFGSSESSLWSTFTIKRAVDKAYDTTLCSGTNKSLTSVSFSFDKKRKELFAFIYSNLYENHIQILERDTIITDPGGIKIKIPIQEKKLTLDTINFRATLTFKY